MSSVIFGYCLNNVRFLCSFVLFSIYHCRAVLFLRGAVWPSSRMGYNEILISSITFRIIVIQIEKMMVMINNNNNNNNVSGAEIESGCLDALNKIVNCY